jgi:HD-GYP domain-containing protein (c-di-GMP phosphodiesterase class II)
MAAATPPSRTAPPLRAGAARHRPMMLVALVAVVAGVAAYLIGAWPGIEHASVDLRFGLRPATRPANLLIVAIDSKTLGELKLRWPFPRSLDARAVDVLHADRARTIVYDVQFTQPTAPREDLALYDAIARARGVVLATTEIGPRGTTSVLGGDANLAAAHARAGAANFRPNSSGVIQKYEYSIGGLKTLAVAAAEGATGRPVSPRAFTHGSAWIDFRGPVGTVPSVSFSDLVRGRVNPAELAGKIVVVGATTPILQDVHATSVTSSFGMSGPEVQASTIWTALRGNPLRDAPGWLALLAIALVGIVAPLCCLKMRATRAFACGLLVAAAYTLTAQVAFDANVILVLTYPLASAAVGALGTLIVSYVLESWERQLSERYRATLEATVEARTAELKETQLDVIHRLGLAAELRDGITGLHIERIGHLCEQLAVRVGVARAEAQMLRYASALHDVGKIGMPDRILLKRGELDAEEWELMKTHTTTGVELLAGSRSPLLQMAETIARTHHERWDGSGYPNGLRAHEIPLVGRICAICDVFDALSSPRPYKQPWPFDRVIKEIRSRRGTHFDPELADAFLSIPTLAREHALASSTISPPQQRQLGQTGLGGKEVVRA